MSGLPKPVVLVAEDEPIIRMMAVEAFCDAGFIVVEAEHAADALALFESRADIEVLFTDVNMPGDLTGVDLAETLLKLAPRLRIIITSALPIIRPIAHLDALFVPKPYDLAKVTTSAQRLLAA